MVSLLKPIGFGRQAFVRANDTVVAKRIRVQASAIDRQIIAERMVESLNALKLHLGEAVPSTWLMRPGIVGQDRVWGGPVSATNSEAKREIRSLVALAQKVIPQDELRTRRGVRIGLDTKLVNFRIDAQGKLVWFDPIGIDVFDPQRAAAERALPLDFTRFDAPSTTW